MTGMNDSEVTIFLLPLAKGSRKQEASAHVVEPGDPPPGKKARKAAAKAAAAAKATGGSKGKGKGKDGKPSAGVPAELAAFSCKTADGSPICFGCNMDGCNRTLTKNRCQRGLHQCVKCGATDHGLRTCPN